MTERIVEVTPLKTYPLATNEQLAAHLGVSLYEILALSPEDRGDLIWELTMLWVMGE